MILSRFPMFRGQVVVLALCTCAMPPFLWAGAKPSIDPNTPEGRLLEKVQAEGDLSKRLMLLELFPDLFPASSSLEYVWGELQARLHQAGKLDKALNAGANALIRNPANLEAACLNWRIAADMKNPALTAAWMKQTGVVAEKALKTPDPERSKATIDCGNSAREANEVEAYQQAVSSKNPAERIKLLEEFLKNHPQTKHVGDIEVAVFLSYREQGDATSISPTCLV